jgi:hypothetical protein
MQDAERAYEKLGEVLGERKYCEFIV